MVLLIPFAICFWLCGITKPKNSAELIEKLVLSISLSIIIYSVIFIFNQDKNFILPKILFYLQAVLSLVGIIKIVRSSRKQLPQLGLTSVVIIAILVKIFMLLLIRPIIDPDVTMSYIPFARSTFSLGYIPHDDLLTKEPTVNPPIGGWTFFLLSMILTGNSHTESFRLFPLVYICLLGVLIYTYAKQNLDSSIAKLSLLSLLLLPFIDEFLTTQALYPDILSTVLFIFLIWQVTNKNLSRDTAIKIGVVLAASFLLKFQNTFLLPITLSLIILKSNIHRYLKFTLFVLPLALFIYLSVNPTSYFTASFPIPNHKILIVTSGLLTILALISSSNSQSISKSWIRNVFLAVIFSSIGYLWIGRNIPIYGLPFSDQRQTSETVFETESFLKKIPELTPVPRGKEFTSLFFLGTFGTLFLIPKVIGMTMCTINKRTRLIILATLFWYFLWIGFMGGQASDRYLTYSIPLISIAIAVGSTRLAGIFKTNATLLILAIGMLSLSQSMFLNWNFASLAFKRPQLRNISETLMGRVDKSETITKNFKESLINIAIKLNSPENKFGNHSSLLFISSVTALSIALVITMRLNKKQKMAPLFFSSIFIIPYLLLALTVSGGDLSKYKTNFRRNIYTYWGFENKVLPLLVAIPKPKATVTVFGPTIPISFETGLGYRNIYNGFGMNEFTSILQERDYDLVARYLQSRNINSFLLFSDPTILNRFRMLKINYPAFEIFEDSKYFSLEVVPDSENSWYYYKSKEVSL